MSGQLLRGDSLKLSYCLAKKAGAEIVSFTYYKVGEGIEKPVDNFAEEVAAQLAAAKQ